MMILLIWITDMLWGKGWKYKPPPDLKHTTSGDTITVTGKVFQKEQKSEYQILYIYYNSYNIYHSKLMIYNKNVTEIHIGNTIEVKGKLQFFETARNPGNFDQLFYYDKQGISGSIFLENIKIVNANVDKVKDGLYQVREKWKGIFREVMGAEKAGIMSAIVLGDKSEMDVEIKELYQKNGIGHIMAISGLHISFVGIGCYRLLRKLGSSFLIAGIIGFTILLLYVVMVGFNVSTLRALIMFGFRIGADILGRVYDMMTGLLVAAVIVVLWRPLSLYDAGFLLSFGAILGILIFNKWLLFLFPCKWKWCEGLYASLSINLMIFPILIYFYFEFPMYSFFLNLLIIPLLSWLLGAGIVGTALYKVTFIFGPWLLKSCGVILDLYQVLCEWANSLPGTRVVFGQPKVWQILCYYGIVFGLFGITRIDKEDGKWKKRYQKITVIAIFAAIGIFTLGHGKKGVLEVTMLDVGQGDGMFMRGPSGATYLVDGGSSDVKNVGKYRMESFLKSQGVSVIDYVFISHGDADHINGITEMLLRQGLGVKIRNIVLPTTMLLDDELKKLAEIATVNNVNVVHMMSGQQIVELAKGKELTVTHLLPNESYSGTIGNASSMVLGVLYGKFHMILTGDLEGEGEQQYVEQEKQNIYPVLKVAHHGSKNASSLAFLKKIEPQIALISAGQNNRYGHPHEETIEKLKNSGVIVYGTQECGAVKLVSRGDEKLLIEGFLLDRKK